MKSVTAGNHVIFLSDESGESLRVRKLLEENQIQFSEGKLGVDFEQIDISLPAVASRYGLFIGAGGTSRLLGLITSDPRNRTARD